MQTETSTKTGGFGFLWCRLVHDAPMWPFRHSYQCRKCGRVHPVQWEELAAQQVPPRTEGTLSLSINQ
jgi:hypothetical protein